MKHDPLIDFIYHHNILSADQILILEEEQKHHNKNIQDLIVDLNFIEKDSILKLLSNHFSIPFIDLSKENMNQYPHENKAVNDLKAYIFKISEAEISIAVEDPLDLFQKDKIKHMLEKMGCVQFIEWYYGNLDYKMQDYITSEKANAQRIENEIHEQIVFYIKKATRLGASDLHFNAKKNTVALYYRIHGRLVLEKTWHKNIQSVLINRLKIIANLDIAQNRCAQSGSFEDVIDHRSVHFRVSTHPSLYGETIAIRILDMEKNRPDLDSLGFPDEILKILKENLLSKQGMILITGSTGSGKTTTLYSCLDYLKNRHLNILTLEDPIEYHLDFVTQTQVSSVFSYDMGIKSLLRQDPDVILVGEIRDAKTAQMAFQAAMTGHLVLSTLHTKDVDTIPHRLEDLGISRNVIDTFMLMALQQSLSPLIHQGCFGKGCEKCLYTGVLGRTLNATIKIF